MIRFADSVSHLVTSEIRDLMSLATAPGIISFAGGMPDNNLFPIDIVDQIYIHLRDEEKQTAMQYGPTSGLPELLDSLSSYLEKKGLPVSENRLMITTGSLQAINILAKTFIDPGDTIYVENPCFIGAISAFKSYRANIASIPLTPEGIDLEMLEERLNKETNTPKLIYITPNFHNPAGTLYTSENKSQLIKLLAGKNIPVIEDDVYSDLYFFDEDKVHLKSIKETNPEGLDVCYTGSFSKILGPGLRLGWMLVPEKIYQKCELIKQSVDACSPSFTQVIADKFIRSEAVYHYISRVRPEYKARAHAMTEMLKKHLPESVTFTEPRGGFYIWLKLPEGADSTNILKNAIGKKTVFVTGKTFDPHGMVNNTMRISFCNTSKEKIQVGIPLLVQAIKEELKA